MCFKHCISLSVGREEYLAKIEKRVKTYDFHILNEPRADKQLLVLDVDYTLFGEDCFVWL